MSGSRRDWVRTRGSAKFTNGLSGAACPILGQTPEDVSKLYGVRVRFLATSFACRYARKAQFSSYQIGKSLLGRGLVTATASGATRVTTSMSCNPEAGSRAPAASSNTSGNEEGLSEFVRGK